MARTPGAELPGPEVGRAVMQRACAKHGVPVKITDPAVLAKVAGMVLEVLDRKAKRRCGSGDVVKAVRSSRPERDERPVPAGAVR